MDKTSPTPQPPPKYSHISEAFEVRNTHGQLLGMGFTAEAATLDAETGGTTLKRWLKHLGGFTLRGALGATEPKA
jgi:hypothetical protein